MAMLRRADDHFKPLITLNAPDCKNWCGYSEQGKDKVKLEKDRDAEKPYLQAMFEHNYHIDTDGRMYITENPLHSAIWDKSPLQQRTPNAKAPQRCDQCMFGCCNELGQPHRKSTRFDSNVVLKFAKQRCYEGAHNGKPHPADGKSERTHAYTSIYIKRIDR